MHWRQPSHPWGSQATKPITPCTVQTGSDSSKVATKWGVWGPKFVGLMFLPRGAYHPCLGPARTFTLEILNGPPACCGCCCGLQWELTADPTQAMQTGLLKQLGGPARWHAFPARDYPAMASHYPFGGRHCLRHAWYHPSLRSAIPKSFSPPTPSTTGSMGQ